jgi:membrane protease YdiL (CAAX protease family)
MVEQHSIARSVLLHLAPGAVFTVFPILATKVLASVGVDPIFALFGGIGLVLVPLELAYLAVHACRATGYWSPLKVVSDTEKMPVGHLIPLVGGLATWFLLWLAISIVVADKWLSENAFSWMPGNLLQFAVQETDGDAPEGMEIAAFILIAFLFNGIAGPVTEELYFRGHLLLRIERFGRWATIIDTALFAVLTCPFLRPKKYLWVGAGNVI